MGQPVIHFEIGGQDGKKLMSFYGKQFGWKIDANNPMKYGVVDTASGKRGINGGVSGAMESGPPAWLTFYIEVPKIDPVLAKIEKAGGKTVMPRTPIPGMITFAQFTDPAGNLVGLIETEIPAPEGAAAKKQAAKKSPTKKQVAKKSPTKKQAAKKSPTKKVAAKKAPAKKKKSAKRRKAA